MLAYYFLGINPSNDGDVIEQAYRKKVRQYPPEKFPEEFKIVRKAYEKIISEQKRLEYYLFDNLMDFSVEEYSRLIIRDHENKTLKRENWEELCRIYREKI